MKVPDIIQALQLSNQYYFADAKKKRIHANSDELVLDPPDIPMPKQDVTLMITLGCVQPDNTRLSSHHQYNPEDYWLIYL